MPRVMVLSKGRKRKLHAIRLTLSEKLTLAALSLLLLGFCFVVGYWMAFESTSETHQPCLEVRR